MNYVVYLLCAATSVLCTVLLAKAYFDRRNQLLLFVSVAFAFLALNNMLLFANLFFVHTEFLYERAATSMAGLLILVYGLIKEATL